MGMSVKDLLEYVDSEEIVEWKAFSNIEPWGIKIDNYRWGLVLSMLANTNRDREKHPDPYEPNDFLPPDYSELPKKAEEKKPEVTPEIRKRNQLLIYEMMKVVTGGGAQNVESKSTGTTV